MDKKKLVAILSAVATFIASLIGVALGVAETSDLALDVPTAVVCEQTDFLSY